VSLADIYVFYFVPTALEMKRNRVLVAGCVTTSSQVSNICRNKILWLWICMFTLLLFWSQNMKICTSWKIPNTYAVHVSDCFDGLTFVLHRGWLSWLKSVKVL